MSFNPLNLIQLKEKFKIFREEHPDMPAFGQALNRRALVRGTTFYLRATTLDGSVIEKEIKLTDNDVEMIRLFVEE